MSQPNWPGALPASPTDFIQWVLSADGSLANLAGRTQDSVVAVLKAQVKASPGWQNATSEVYADLRRGVPLPLAIIEAIANQMFDNVNRFFTTGEALQAIERVPGVSQLEGLLSAAKDNLDGTAAALESFLLNGDGTVAFFGSISDAVAAAKDKFDGTAELISGMILNGDGTVSYGPILGSHPLRALVDNIDGTVMGAGAALHNLLNPVGTHLFNLDAWQAMFADMGLSGAPQLVASLRGLLPAALDNFDGTALATGVAQIVAQFDGTVSLVENQLGASPLAKLIDNADGTAMSLAHLVDNAAAALPATIATTKAAVDGIAQASGLLGTNHTVPDMVSALQSALAALLSTATWASFLSQANTALVTGGTDLTHLITGLGAIPGGNIAGALNTALTLQGARLDAIFNGSAHFIGVLDAAATGALNTALTVGGNAIGTLLTNIDSAGKWAGNLASLGTTVGGYFANLNSSGVWVGALTSSATVAGTAITTLLTNLNSAGSWTGALSTLGLSTILANLDAANGKWTGNLATLGTTIGNYFTNLSSSGVWTGALTSAATVGGTAITVLLTNIDSAGKWAGNLASLGTTVGGYFANISSSGVWTGALTSAATVGGVALTTLLQNLSATGTLVASALTGTWSNMYTALGAMTAGNIGNILTSWATVLNGLGALTTGNITTALTSWSNMATGLGAMTTGNITSVLTSWSTVLTGLGALTTGNITTALTSWSTVLTGLGALTTGNITSALTNWSNVLTGLGSPSTGNLTTLLTSWSSVLTGLGAMTTGNITSLLTNWSTVLTGLGAMSTANITSALTSWSNLFTSLGAMTTGNITNILTSWSQLVSSLGTFDAANLAGAINSAATLLGSTLSTLFGATFPKSLPYTIGAPSAPTTAASFVTSDQFQQLVDGLANNGLSNNAVTAAVGAYQQGLQSVKADVAQAVLDGVNAEIVSEEAIAIALGSFPSSNINNVLGNTHLGSDVQVLAAAVSQLQAQVSGLTYGRIALLAANFSFYGYPNSPMLPSPFTAFTGIDLGFAGWGSMGVSNGHASFVTGSGGEVESYYYNVSATSTDYQTISVVVDSLPPTYSWQLYLCGRVNAGSNATVIAKISATGNASNPGPALATVFSSTGGAAFGGVTSYFTPAVGVYTLYCGTVAGNDYYDFQLNGVSILGGAVRDSNGSATIGASYRYGGFLLFPLAGLSSVPNVTNFSIADNTALLTAPGLPATAYVATSESTTSTSYTDLTTTTDTVTVTIGSSGIAQLFLSWGSVAAGNVPANQEGLMSFAASGANTISAADGMCVGANTASAMNFNAGTPFLLTGLTAGSTTFKAKYRSVVGGATPLANRRISVIPM